MAPLHARLDRTDCEGAKCGEKSVTLGAALEKTVVPAVPSAQRSGTLPRFDEYDCQSGVGTASPMHSICCAPLGNPVLSSAAPIMPEFAPFVKTPIPPRTTARGRRASPK